MVLNSYILIFILNVVVVCLFQWWFAVLHWLRKAVEYSIYGDWNNRGILDIQNVTGVAATLISGKCHFFFANCTVILD